MKTDRRRPAFVECEKRMSIDSSRSRGTASTLVPSDERSRSHSPRRCLTPDFTIHRRKSCCNAEQDLHSAVHFRNKNKIKKNEFMNKIIDTNSNCISGASILMKNSNASIQNFLFYDFVLF